ncbi:hypothetical protein HOG48_06025 [Candidatus Peregrinibacteria bacterium]|jgi:hypothetical protein|nr:hypothetical protein [Candidatus Peregrinibacteria bacterium]
MELVLSWDLFIMIFFAIIVAYSFIVGKTQTIKIVLCAYLAILFADGMGNLVEFHLRGVSPMVDLLLKYIGEDVFVLGKVLLFVFTTVFLTVRGGFAINMDSDRGFVNIVMTFVFAVLSAGLIVSTILMFISGYSLIAGGPGLEASTIAEIRNQSQLVGLMVDHYNWWFSMPAFTFLIFSLLKGGGSALNE